MRRTAAALAGLLALVAGHPVVTGALPPAPAATGWHSFEGTWTAIGRRTPIEIEDGGTAVIVEFSGAVAVTHGSGLSHGFQGRLIGYDDGQDVSVGRVVWTDGHGDRIYSRLRGERLEAGKRLVGTITGGTGRYAGIMGEYTFSWQYMIPGEDGTFEVRAGNLSGRFRRVGESP
jgi:hypothetical protein